VVTEEILEIGQEVPTNEENPFIGPLQINDAVVNDPVAVKVLHVITALVVIVLLLLIVPKLVIVPVLSVIFNVLQVIEPETTNPLLLSIPELLIEVPKLSPLLLQNRTPAVEFIVSGPVDP